MRLGPEETGRRSRLLILALYATLHRSFAAAARRLASGRGQRRSSQREVPQAAQRVLTASVDWRRNLAALWFAQLTAIFGFSFAFPFLPVYLRQLGIHDAGALAVWTGVAGGASGAAPSTAARSTPNGMRGRGGSPTAAYRTSPTAR